MLLIRQMLYFLYLCYSLKIFPREDDITILVHCNIYHLRYMILKVFVRLMISINIFVLLIKKLHWVSLKLTILELVLIVLVIKWQDINFNDWLWWDHQSVNKLWDSYNFIIFVIYNHIIKSSYNLFYIWLSM
jgi:hypothetical protein